MCKSMPVLPVAALESAQDRKMERIVSKHKQALAANRKAIMDFLEVNGFESGNVNSRRASWISISYPLHEAVKQQNVRMVALLLKFGADPRAKDHFGRTAHGLASKRHHLEVLDIFDKRLGGALASKRSSSKARTVPKLAILPGHQPLRANSGTPWL